MKKALITIAVVVVSVHHAWQAYHLAVLESELEDAHRRINVVQALAGENEIRLDGIKLAE